ncbi:unnamed protein product [Fraxinus pennsylvanica]|uniref:non-specific serine/threonine protein kinase n=1 Tax=Fraxinus pennsylvanica TaxID=56036 RepID=A0AAD1Z721_9LAMI|nr:unnamed protein product [Fraxinus pennsylvanica]
MDNTKFSSGSQWHQCRAGMQAARALKWQTAATQFSKAGIPWDHVTNIVSLWHPCSPVTCSNNQQIYSHYYPSRKPYYDPLGTLNSWNEREDFCIWKGIFCGSRHPNRVVSINLRSQGLVGNLSPYLGNLSFLRTIILQNNTFYGQIPAELGRLKRLEFVEFSNNSFGGTIPGNLSQCSNIYYLNLIENQLTGIIPPELGSLLKLEALGLSKNNLIGNIPAFIGNLTSLSHLSLATCGFHGDIPESLVQLQSLIFLQLSGNSLTGNVPSGLFNISTIVTLGIASNQLQGTILPEIGSTLPNLRFLDVGSNHFIGAAPFSLSDASLLTTLGLYSNSFTGMMLKDFSRLSGLQYFIFSSNYFQGDFSFISPLTNCTSLEVLVGSSNLLAGSLPNSIVNLSSNLGYLGLSENQVQGTIPSGVENLHGLAYLDISNNDLIGMIPSAIGKLTNLQEIYMGINGITSEIPSSIGNLTLLNHLSLEKNKIYGSIPQSLSNCSNLLSLDLSHNNLSGSIPQEIMSLASISIAFNLSYNAFTGPIPHDVGYLINLINLDLSYNGLSGSIPNSLMSCISLQRLQLEANSLDGEIPKGLGSLKGLQHLDISHNNLSGPIPIFLGELPLLRLNLSFNRLQGKVPVLGVFQNATAISVNGNNELCGGISDLKLPPCLSTNPRKKKFSTLLKILTPILIAGGALTLSGCFYGILNDGQTLVAVKVLRLHVTGASRSFMAECNALRGARHRNLLKILSICLSTDFQGTDFKALVYEFKANGSLEKLLHHDENTRNITLMQRPNIAIDIASALEYLHCGTGSITIHGDLKPSNILLDDNMTAYVGDFGLAKVISNISSTYPTHDSSSIAIKGTIGYIAPDHANLHNYVSSAIPGRVMEILDPIMQLENNITSKIKDSIAGILGIGVACSKEFPRDRMSITDVDTELHRTRSACTAEGLR